MRALFAAGAPNSACVLLRAQSEALLRGLVIPLREIREHHWTAMNSFVHGGLHPISRIFDGFPVKLATDLLKSSNGMLHMGGQAARPADAARGPRRPH